jgi:hypothetical protein
MSLANKVTALLTGLTPNQVQAMPPVERQNLADQRRRIAALAEPRTEGSPTFTTGNGTSERGIAPSASWCPIPPDAARW